MSQEEPQNVKPDTTPPTQSDCYTTIYNILTTQPISITVNQYETTILIDLCQCIGPGHWLLKDTSNNNYSTFIYILFIIFTLYPIYTYERNLLCEILNQNNQPDNISVVDNLKDFGTSLLKCYNLIKHNQPFTLEPIPVILQKNDLDENDLIGVIIKILKNYYYTILTPLYENITSDEIATDTDDTNSEQDGGGGGKSKRGKPKSIDEQITSLNSQIQDINSKLTVNKVRISELTRQMITKNNEKKESLKKDIQSVEAETQTLKQEKHTLETQLNTRKTDEETAKKKALNRRQADKEDKGKEEEDNEEDKGKKKEDNEEDNVEKDMEELDKLIQAREEDELRKYLDSDDIDTNVEDNSNKKNDKAYDEALYYFNTYLDNNDETNNDTQSIRDFIKHLPNVPTSKIILFPKVPIHDILPSIKKYNQNIKKKDEKEDEKEDDGSEKKAPSSLLSSFFSMFSSSSATPTTSTSNGPGIYQYIQNNKSVVFGVFLIVCSILIAIVLLVIMSNQKPQKKVCPSSSPEYGPPPPVPKPSSMVNVQVTENMINKLISDNITLIEIYNSKYDKIKVNYRKAYYESLNADNIQKWTPRLQTLYLVCYIILAGIYIYKAPGTMFKKIMILLSIFVMTNVTVLKFILLFIIYLYNVLSVRYLYNINN